MPRKITRQIALSCGLTKYKGKPCPDCYDSWRYTANSTCVTCAKLRAKGIYLQSNHGRECRQYRALARAERQAAMIDGATYYPSRVPCHAPGHGAPIRYASNGQCVACARHKAAARNALRLPMATTPLHVTSPLARAYLAALGRAT